MDILSIIDCLLLLIVSGTGIIRYQRLTLPFKILTWSVIIVFILSILANVFAIKYRNNAPILQIECIAEYVFYSLTYYYLFKNKLIKKVITTSIVIISVSFFINAVFIQPFNKIFPTNIYPNSHTFRSIFIAAI